MATIGRTFSDPDKWEENWFFTLPIQFKHTYNYLWERCDHAGVIEVILPIWNYHTGIDLDREKLNKFISLVNKEKERIVDLNSKLWFTEYIRFNQQTDSTKGLSPGYSFHKHVWKRIKYHNLVEEIHKRDPILLKDFIDLNEMETVTSKANGRLKQGFDKKTGKGLGKGGGEGKGLPSSTFDKASKLFDHYRHVVRYEQEYPDHIEVGIFQKILEKGLSYDTLVSDIEEYASELDGKHGESPELFYERYAEVNHE